MRTRVRIQPYIGRDLHRKLRSWAAAQDVTESAVTEAALTEYLDNGRADEDVISRRLDLLGGAVSRLQNDLNLLADAFGRYVRQVFLTAVYRTGTDAETKYEAFVRGILDDSAVPGAFIGDVRRARLRRASGPAADRQPGGR